LIVSADPISGAKERIGWLAVNVNANDIATFGVEPAFFLSCLLFPEKADERMLETICSDMDQAAKNLGIAIIGGHSEVTPGLTNPIVVGCAVGLTEKDNYVTAGGAKPRDNLILTKTAGIEGTAILAHERNKQMEDALPRTLLLNARKFYDRISVVKDALTAFKTGGVNAMHDPTEGGISGGIHEMADAANLGVKIFKDRIAVARETVETSRLFDIDPLQLISSGALLIASKPKFTAKILKRLNEEKIEASVIGEFLDSPRTRLLINEKGKETKLIRPEQDHLWKALQDV